MSAATKKAYGRERATFAWDCVKQGVGLGKEYRALLRRAPALIKTDGLGPALAFFHSKRSEKHFGSLLNSLEKWLDKTQLISPGEDFVRAVLDLDSPRYRAATNEALMLLIWMSRFASGLIKGE